MTVLQRLENNRVFSRGPMSEKSAQEHRQAMAEHIEAPFRELLEYFEKQSVESPYTSLLAAYRDAANRLRDILE